MTMTELKNMIHETFQDKIGNVDEMVQKAINQKLREYNTPIANKMLQPQNSEKIVAATGRKDYQSVFKTEVLSKDGFRSFGEFFQAVKAGNDPRLRIFKDLNEAIPAEGGFLVPEEYAAAVINTALENEIVRKFARFVPMKHKVKNIPGFSIGDHSSNLYGGVVAYWLAEGATGTRTAPKTRQVKLSAEKLAAYMRSSNELIADADNSDTELADIMGKAVGWFLDYAFLTGDGAGKPLGLLNSPCKITIAKETGQAAATIVWDNIVNMYARLFKVSRTSTVWIANNTCKTQLLQLTIPVGTGGTVYPALKESLGNFTMLGFPVLFTEKTSALGTEGDLILTDLSQYAVGMRKEVVLDSTNAQSWMTDERDYRAIVRVDGQSLWDSVLTPKHGDTLSPVITLADRA